MRVIDRGVSITRRAQINEGMLMKFKLRMKLLVTLKNTHDKESDTNLGAFQVNPHKKCTGCAVTGTIFWAMGVCIYLGPFPWVSFIFNEKRGGANLLELPFQRLGCNNYLGTVHPKRVHSNLDTTTTTTSIIGGAINCNP